MVEHKRGRVLQKKKSQTNSSQIYIGLDFGTAFTKASYEIASQKHNIVSVKFRDTKAKEKYFIPSKLYFDAETKTLSMEKENDAFSEIKYFKYTMIDNSLAMNENLYKYKSEINSNLEQLCAVFFLSRVILKIRKTVTENPIIKNLKSDSEVEWFINMGVPILETGEKSKIYKTVLTVAYQYAMKHPQGINANLIELNNFFEENKGVENPNLNVLPELYAEILLFLQNKNIKEGFYAVVDVGGGTTDIATFYKKITKVYGAEEHDITVSCISQEVCKLGFDSLCSKISQMQNETVIGDIKKYLKNCNIGYYRLDKLEQLSEYNILTQIDAKKFYESITDFRKSYGECLIDAHDKQRELMGKMIFAKQPLRYFVMGGAKEVTFYKHNIERMTTAHKNAGIPEAQKDDISHYLKSDSSFEIHNPRLLISQMLAKPYELIPSLDNMPWDFVPFPNSSKTGVSMREKLDDILNERYPK